MTISRTESGTQGEGLGGRLRSPGGLPKRSARVISTPYYRRNQGFVSLCGLPGRLLVRGEVGLE